MIIFEKKKKQKEKETKTRIRKKLGKDTHLKRRRFLTMFTKKAHHKKEKTQGRKHIRKTMKKAEKKE